MSLSQPQVDMAEGCLRITTAGNAKTGVKAGEQCINPYEWRGFIEVFAEPQLDEESSTLTCKPVDYVIFDESHKKIAGDPRIRYLVKSQMYPRFEKLTIDFSKQLNDLRTLLPTLLPGTEEEKQKIIASLKLDKPQLAEDGLGITVSFTVPSQKTPLEKWKDKRKERLQARWQRWDAFLTFVIKRLARNDHGPLRDKMLDVFMDARYALLEVIAAVQVGTVDPAPGLFLKTWRELKPLMRESAKSHAEMQDTYTEFISAADTLAALTASSSATGMEASDDSLRAIARKLDPTASEDPVRFSYDVDSELRTLMGFGEALPPPRIDPNIELSSAQPDDGCSVVCRNMKRLHLCISELMLPSAAAAIDSETLTQLNRWAPVRNDVANYLPLLKGMLQDLSQKTLANSKLDAQYHTLYNNIVLTTAWQESCWRQFIKKGEKITPLKSDIGSVGLMQINQNVWRGVYDVTGLQGDISYNGLAGCEILMQYLRNYALKKGEHLQPGGVDNLARSTYAIYNGGPGHRTRYRKPDTKPSLKKIDELWWQKYQVVRTGSGSQLKGCYE
jgi:hypothetical protein